MRLSDENIQTALKNANITMELINSGNLAGSVEQASQGLKSLMLGEENVPQLIMILEDLKFYKSKVEEMKKTLEWYADDVIWVTTETDGVYAIEPIEYVGDGPWTIARQALKGQAT